MSDSGYERDDASTRGVWIFVVGLAVALILIFVGVGGFLHWLSEHPSSSAQASRIAEPDYVPPGPALQAVPKDDLETYQHRERKLLDSYGWTNRNQGIVRIPIERAMELVVKRGVNGGQPMTPLEMQGQKAKEHPP